MVRRDKRGTLIDISDQSSVTTTMLARNAIASAVAPTSAGFSRRIGINCLDVNPAFVGGVTTYVFGLLEGFARLETNCRFRLFVSRANQHLFNRFEQYRTFDISVVDTSSVGTRGKLSRASLLCHSDAFYKFVSNLIFEDVRELMDSESDLVYTPTPVLRCFNGRKPTVLTMHDIQHLHYPEFFNWSRRLSRRITYGLSARHANYLQANSKYTKEDLLKHFSWLLPDQVEVIPSGVLIEQFADSAKDSSVRERHSIPGRYLFFPAQLWPHKNHVTLLKALKCIEKEHNLRIPLVLTGERFSAAPDIFRFIADHSMDYVKYLGKVSRRELIALYQQATFVVTATLHESSSLPILEAAAAGTPVIASRIPPIEELGEKLRLNLFDPLDVDGLSELIVCLWRDEQTPFEQAAHNREYVSYFSWENTARKYLQLFERVLHAPAGRIDH